MDVSKPNVVDGLKDLLVPIDTLVHLPGNARRGEVEAIKKSLKKFKQHKALVVQRSTNQVLIGNHTLMAARELGWDSVPVLYVDDDEAMAKARALADNRASELGGYDEEALADLIADVYELDASLLEAASYSEDDLLAMLEESAGEPEPEEPEGDEPSGPPPDWDPKADIEKQFQKREKLSLFDRFLVPPFTVMNARDGWWVERKRAWLEMGIEGELGREDKPRTWYIAAPAHHAGGVTPEGSAERRKAGEDTEEGLLYGDGSTSVFDPVLCEIAYRWFCPPGGEVYDNFAGGSVRGIIAAMLGRSYTGIELREVQVHANEKQGDDVLTRDDAIVPDVPDDFMPELTPIENVDGVYLKREDLYAYAGVRGAKVRACMAFVQKAKDLGVGVITAGARQSPQVNFVAQIASRMGVRCRVHVPSGKLTPEILAARAAGAKVIQHEAGYNTVIIKGARDDAAASGWVEIPYGMESQESVDFTAPQVANIPKKVKRIVNATGSGMTLAGILHGLKNEGRDDVKVIAVCVGHVPEDRLDKWAPEGWRDMVEIVDLETPYDQAAKDCYFGGVQLDPYYEAKCLPYLQSGDLFWLSAIRPSAVAAKVEKPTWLCGDSTEDHFDKKTMFDMIFTCPPYGDLEVYSDDPRDLSNMPYEDFISGLQSSMDIAYKHLRDDSFAVVVVGDFRDKDGYFRNFPGDTVRVMEKAGFKYLNEGILVTQLASLPIRVGRQFDATRKFGKTHQQILVFVKGDAKKATQRCGPVVSVDFEDTEDDE